MSVIFLKKNYFLLGFCVLILISSNQLFGQIKIGNNIQEVSPFALLELESSTKGLLIPRMNTVERDLAFNQDAPTGMEIFNTGNQVIEVYMQEVDPVTGKKEGNKVWQQISEEIHSEGMVPQSPHSGDLYYNEDSKTLFLWDPIKKLWIPLVSLNNYSTIVGETDPTQLVSNTITSEILNAYSIKEVLLEADIPSNSGVTSFNNVRPGMLYVNSKNGDIYTAVDANSDGAVEQWRKIEFKGTQGGGGSDNQTFSITISTLSISGGNSVNILVSSGGGTAGSRIPQTLSLVGKTHSISWGNNVTLTNCSSTDTQTLSFNSNSHYC